MAGYLIAQIVEITDTAGYQEYREKVGGVIEQYGGRFLVRGGSAQVREGEWPGRTVVVEFESAARATEFYDSPEYRPLLELRKRCSTGRLILVEGV